MSSDKEEKKEGKKLKEMVDTYTLIKKEDSGVRLKRSIGVDEDSGVKMKVKPTDKGKEKEA